MSDHDLAVGDTCASIGAIARVVLHPALATPDPEIPTSTGNILSPWGGAVLPAGVTAAGMSTFASVLMITSGAVIRDIVQEGSGHRLSERSAIGYSRLAALAVGLISPGIAIRPPALIPVLTAFSWAAIAATCLWPFLPGLYSKWATRARVVASMIVGLATALVWTAGGVCHCTRREGAPGTRHRCCRAFARP